MTDYLNWLEVPKKKRFTKGAKFAFFTNHDYNEVIIPDIVGENVMSYKDYIKRFAYGNGILASNLIRNCIEYQVPAELVLGITELDGEEYRQKFHVSDNTTVPINAILRGGVFFIYGDFFGRVYFPCPDTETFHEIKNWLNQLSRVMKSETKGI